jgi:sialate O-acetylesterase
MKHLFTIAIALLLAPLAMGNAADAPTKRPNILLILADDMGWGDLRCHGNEKLDTPALDKLQSQSVELEHFHVSPVCSPTRSSLLTGRHHFRLRVLNTTSGLETMHGDEVTLAEALKPAGYVSGCFGKWHNGANHPTTARGQGFDEFSGFVGGFFSNYFDPELEHNGVTAARKGFITDVLADSAMAFIEKHRAQPFFCYVPFNACHSPMQAPDGLFAKYTKLGFEPKTAAVYAMIENLDANVGRLLVKLDSLGLAENTLVMFATDNGPNTPRFNGGMRGGKGSLFEGGQRVPCFIRWPGKLEAGKRVSQIAQHVDVLPTLLDLVGLPLPATPPLDGVSLAPLLRGEAVKWPERLLFEVTGRGGKDGTLIPKYPGTVRSDTHRWVHDNKQEMLFDLLNDPGEKNNIATQQPQITELLSRAYDQWFNTAIASTQGKVQRFPISLGEGTELLAPFATLEGGAKFFGQGWDNDWAVFPTATATITWNLEVPQAGTYEVTALHTAQEQGGKIKVTAGEHLVEHSVTTAYDPHELPRRDLVKRWEVPDKQFAPLKLGRLAVPAGAQVFRVMAAPGLEIQSVRLSRVEKITAELKLPFIFSDHMVLQSAKPVPVWGWADAGEKVVVEFAGQSKSSTANSDGKWMVNLDALKVSSTSRELIVRSLTRSSSLKIADVIVGEVWAGGGQSNMEFDMKAITSATAEIEASANPTLRQFHVLKHPSARTPVDDVQGYWTVARPGTTEDFMAAGYYFAKSIQRELKMPVGLIKVCWGGSKVEPWISPASLASVPELAAGAKNMDAMSERNKSAFREWLKRTRREDRTSGDVSRFLSGPVSKDDGWVAVKDSGPVSDPSLPKFGAFWFRKEVSLSKRQTGAAQVLQFGPTTQFDQVYWNGTLIGERSVENFTGLISVRHYLIPPTLLKEGVNKLAVRLFAPAEPPGFSWFPSVGTTKILGGWMAKAEYALPPLDASGKKAAPPLTGQQVLPGRLFNGMVHPILPYAIRGVLWYQGESNTGNASLYRTSFPLLIKDWRQHWQQGDFPFYFCQLANYRPKTNQPGESVWADLREAQAKTLAMPNTGMAVLIDTGESEDIHPQTKQIAGERLAKIALAKTYSRNVVPSGPLYTSMKIEGSAIRLSFDHLGGGLVAKELPATYDVMRKAGKTAPLVRSSPQSQLEGFAICGPDKKWVWAEAKIEGDTVLVSAKQVVAPIAVRYGWSNNPTCNLYNAADLPAQPFRTDDPISITEKNTRP